MPEPIIDSVEVQPSEDNGNVPIETPSPAPAPATPAEVVVESATKPAEPETYELPDGRKVDAQTLTREWKENFLPDYTRKSQELAKVKTPDATEIKPVDPLADPNWQPQSYAELLKVSEERAVRAIEQKEQDRINARQAVEDQVASQLTDIKKTDPSVDENKLFVHATKYGFRDLKQAHQNMADMAALAKTVQQTTVKNIAKRADPVSISPGATGAKLDPSHFANARDYVRSLNNAV